MSRRVLIICLVFLFVLFPYSLSLPGANNVQAETHISSINITVDTTWDQTGSPYVINGYLSINPGATLTIEPGVIIKLTWAAINVGGKIIVQGTENNPVVFTSINDDSRGGKTVEESTGNPQAGDWRGITVYNGGILSLDYSVINYGGTECYELVKGNAIIKLNQALAQPTCYDTGAIVSYGGEVAINHSKITNNRIGVIAGDYYILEGSSLVGQASIHNSEIFNNAQGGLLNNGENSVDATNNWWGDNSGPHNINSNPNGQGDEVGDNVLFDPWTSKAETAKKIPVIIVPGILGSYLNDQTGEEIWPKIPSMIIDPWDLHLNRLALPEDGVPTGNSIMIPSDIFRSILNKDFFQGLITELKSNGYKDEGDDANLFIFPYDWRWNLNMTAGDDPFDNIKSLNEKVKEVKQKTSSDKVDIIAHSMGGLIAKLYIKKYGQNSVDKFIDIGTPHLGAPNAFKILTYGDNLGINIAGIFNLYSGTAKKISQNFPSIYQLLPSRKYFDNADPAYKNYIGDIYDYDNNGVKNNLNYDQSIEFMKNTGRNENLLATNDSLHNEIDDYSPQSAGIKTYNIVGCSQPTIGKIYILNKEKSGGYEYGLQYINGDGTVPLRSAKYLTAEKSYYINNTEHAYLPSADGVKQLVAAILKGNDNSFNLTNYSHLSSDDSICSFSGIQIEYHSPIELHVYDSSDHHVGPDANGDIEMGIEGAQYDIIDNNKFAFLPLGSDYRIVGRATSKGSFDAHIRFINDGKYVRTIYFHDIPLASTSSNIQILTDNQDLVMQIDQDGDGIFEAEHAPDAILDEEESQDLEKPTTNINLVGEIGDNGWYKSDVGVTLHSEDNEGGAGVLKTEYSLDNGQTWLTYQQPFSISQEGTTTIFYQATDKASNIEKTKENIVKIDRVKPTIDIAIPYDDQEFSQVGTLEPIYEVGDSTSGVANSSLGLDGNYITASTIDLSNYNLGEHVFKIEATDLAGNKAETEVKFNIVKDIATIASTIKDIERLYKEGEIYKKIVEETLVKELQFIKSYEEKYGKKQKKFDDKQKKAFSKCIKKKNQEWCEEHINTNKIDEYCLDINREKNIKGYYQALLYEMDIFYKKKWLSKNAYDIIKNDINNLIDNL
jgi:hypothetical protein